MKRILRSGAYWVAMGFATAVSGVFGASPVDTSAVPSSLQVDLFDAKRAGQIDVKLIPQNSKLGTVIITNNTTVPLTIRLPEAFAGVPVLAQRGGRGGGIGGNAGGGLGGGGGGQGVGGGFGGGGGGGLGGGGGVFNIGPERVSKVKIVSVCLEHGKLEPNPRVPYDLVPIDDFANDPSVIELVKMLARGEIDQPAAQAVAWHVANGLTWQQLAEKIGVKHINGTTESYFSKEALKRAQQIAVEAHRRVRRDMSRASSLGDVSFLDRQ